METVYTSKFLYILHGFLLSLRQIHDERSEVTMNEFRHDFRMQWPHRKNKIFIYRPHKAFPPRAEIVLVSLAAPDTPNEKWQQLHVAIREWAWLVVSMYSRTFVDMMSHMTVPLLGIQFTQAS